MLHGNNSATLKSKMKEILIFQIRSNHKWETQEPDVEELHEPDADESNEPKVFPNFMMCKYYSKLNKRKSKNLKSNETQRGVGWEVNSNYENGKMVVCTSRLDNETWMCEAGLEHSCGLVVVRWVVQHG